MKRRLLLCCVSVLTATGFHSCIKAPCNCDPISVQEIECKIVNQSGQNLVRGQQAVFTLDSLKALKQPNNFLQQAAAISSSFDSSSLSVYFYTPEPKIFLYYNQQTPQDSVEVSWTQKQGKCCGEFYTYSAIERVTFNGKVVQPQNGIYIFVKQ